MAIDKTGGTFTARVKRRGHVLTYTCKTMEEALEKEREMKEDILVRLTMRRYYFHEDRVLIFHPMSRETYRKKNPTKPL
jgi:hypothetical protein